ncbi:MAG: adenylate kinase [Acidobacteriota bacterium]
MNLILLGPPGAGKGTQAAAIVRSTGLPHISTGNIIREAIAKDTPLGREFKAYAESGRLVPDELVNRLVEERLGREDCAHGFLLDGYPRTIAQALELDGVLGRRGRSLDHVLLLDVADAVLIERITGRRTDPETGRVYHLTFDPPPAGIARRLVQRADDSEDVLKRRLSEYHEKTDPLIPYYEEAGLLRRVAGTGSVTDVQRRTLAVLTSVPAGPTHTVGARS